MCDKKAGCALSLALLDISCPGKAGVHLVGTTGEGYPLWAALSYSLPATLHAQLSSERDNLLPVCSSFT